MAETTDKPGRSVANILRFFVARQSKQSSEGSQRVGLLYPSSGDEAEDSMMAQSLLPFCFPLGQHAPVNAPAEPHYFVVSDADGHQKHGFCQPINVEDTDDTVICLLAPFPWFQPFRRATEVLAHLLLCPEESMLVVGLPPNLPSSSPPASFLDSLSTSLNPPPTPGTVMRLQLPRRTDYQLPPLWGIAIDVGPDTPIPPSLTTGAEYTEVQVPPQPKGPPPPDIRRPVVPFARLLYVLPPPVLATLCASLLAERRIILTSTNLNNLASAVLAASQILSPFRWHHVLLPVVPVAALDVLSSPIPFLVGLPAALQDAAPWDSMGDHVLVDLDHGTISPAVGTPYSDSGRLPGWEDLTETFSILMVHLKSADEHRANGTITSLIHEFLAASLGRYREFIKSPSQGPPRPATGAAAVLRTPRASSATSNSGQATPPVGDAGLAAGPPGTPGSGTGETPSTPGSESQEEETIIKGENGFRFYHAAFASSFASRANREFARALYNTQMWQVFIRERMDMMQKPFVAMDAFESKAMAHAAKGRSMSATISDTVVRVKESDARAAISRWTKKGTGAAFAFGRRAAEKMGKGVQRAKGALGKSGSDGLDRSGHGSERAGAVSPEISHNPADLVRVPSGGASPQGQVNGFGGGNGFFAGLSAVPEDSRGYQGDEEAYSPPHLQGRTQAPSPGVWSSPTLREEEEEVADITSRTAGLSLRATNNPQGRHSRVSSEDALNYPPAGVDGDELVFSDSSDGDLSKMI